MKTQCIQCKGRSYCGRSFCPIVAKSSAMFKVRDDLNKSDFTGSAPAPFVGHHGYPYLNVGVLSTPFIVDEVWEYDAPRYWANKNYEIKQIVDFRSSLINSRFKAHAHDKNKLLSLSQEVGMASLPVDIEINLEDKPKFRLSTDPYTAPIGANAKLKKAFLTSNPKIHTKVDKVFSDTDLKANDAVLYLYKNNFDENFLSKILSVGTIGVKRNRKLVPTRWSITAVDDNIGKNIIEEIKNFSETNYYAYFGNYLGNYYLILTFPEKWSYELFETYLPKASWNQSEKINFTTDYEGYDGRKGYADNTVGGYYAARLPILEKLKKDKKQGTVLALRFITGDYAVPLGVWVCRESVRKTVNNKPIEFSSRELMLNYAKILVKKKFGIDLDKIINKSKILENLKNQTKLQSFF